MAEADAIKILKEGSKQRGNAAAAIGDHIKNIFTTNKRSLLQSLSYAQLAEHHCFHAFIAWLANHTKIAPKTLCTKYRKAFEYYRKANDWPLLRVGHVRGRASNKSSEKLALEGIENATGELEQRQEQQRQQQEKQRQKQERLRALELPERPARLEQLYPLESMHKDRWGEYVQPPTKEIEERQQAMGFNWRLGKYFRYTY